MSHSAKKQMLADLISAVEKELALAKAAAAAAVSAATGEENKAENQYDTRALEASYLARAQNVRSAEMERALKNMQEVPERSFDAKTPISSGALVELATEEGSVWYFVLPGGAGLSTRDGSRRVQVLTPESPLGRLVCGRKCGDTFSLPRAGGAKEYEVVSVS